LTLGLKDASTRSQVGCYVCILNNVPFSSRLDSLRTRHCRTNRTHHSPPPREHHTAHTTHSLFSGFWFYARLSWLDTAAVALFHVTRTFARRRRSLHARCTLLPYLRSGFWLLPPPRTTSPPSSSVRLFRTLLLAFHGDTTFHLPHLLVAAWMLRLLRFAPSHHYTHLPSFCPFCICSLHIWVGSPGWVTFPCLALLARRLPLHPHFIPTFAAGVACGSTLHTYHCAPHGCSIWRFYS